MAKSVSDYIFTSFDSLPASQIARDEMKNAINTFELTTQAIKAKLQKAEEVFKKARKETRLKLSREFVVTKVSKEDTPNNEVAYKIKRIIKGDVEIMEGDEEHYVDHEYQLLRIVNNVAIIGGNGYLHPCNTGDIISDRDLDLLHQGIVPDRYHENYKTWLETYG